MVSATCAQYLSSELVTETWENSTLYVRIFKPYFSFVETGIVQMKRIASGLVLEMRKFVEQKFSWEKKTHQNHLVQRLCLIQDQNMNSCTLLLA